MESKGYRECPVCAEWIREKAKLCRFCGALLTNEPLPAFVPSGIQGIDAELRDSVDKRFAEMGVDLSEAQRQRIVDFLKHSEDQYRSATVFFCDLTGYTRISQQITAEETKDILDVYYKCFVQAVEFYNGFVVEFAGDGGLAVFGAPLAFGRDAEAAVRAAWDVRERIRALPPFGGVKVEVSAGLATGEILSSIIRTKTPAHYKLYGHAVNLASRVEDAAGPDSILIDEATHDLIRKAFECEVRPPSRFKNVEKAVTTYVVKAPIGKRVPARLGEVPFLGRDAELEALGSIWRAFRERLTNEAGSREWRGAVLTGEPGIGKSRLAREFVRRHCGEARVVEVENAPFAAKIPWGLWRSVLISLWSVPPEESLDSAREVINERLQESGFRGADQNPLKLLFGFPEAVAALSSLSPDLVRKLILADLRRLLKKSSRETPLVLLLDDFQWADSASMEMLDPLCLDGSLLNVFFLVIHRLEYALPSDLEALLPGVRVGFLDLEAREALFNLLLDVREFLPEIRERFARESEGNPFYLLELVWALKKKIAEAREEGETADSQRGWKTWIPPSLQQMLQVRIDLLEQRRKEVLQCAAVLGKRFAYRILSLFVHIREGLLANLYSLKALEFLDDLPAPEGLEFLFRHHAMREVAYRSLLERHRRDLHKSIAEAIAKAFADEPDPVLPLLAYHYGRSDAEERAIHYMQQAADRAVVVGAVSVAHEHYDEALTRLRSKKPTQDTLTRLARIQRMKGRLLRLAGEPDLALDYLDSATRDARESGNAREKALTEAELGLIYLLKGDYSQAEARLVSALRGFGKRRELGPRAVILNGLGGCAWGRGEFQKAKDHYEKVARMRLGKRGVDLSADAHNNLALLEWKAGRLDAAERLLSSTLELRQASGNKYGIALTLVNLGIVQENTGHWEAAERTYREALEVAERIQSRQVMTSVHANLGNLHLNAGRAAEALECSARALSIAEEIGDRRSAAIAMENLSLSHLGLGRHEDARHWLKKGQTVARRLKDKERIFSLRLVAIEIALSTGGAVRVDRLIRQAEELLDQGSFEAERPRFLRICAQFQIQKGNRAGARELRDEGLRVARKQHNRAEEKRLLALEEAR